MNLLKNDNDRLEFATLITSLGDFISKFSFLKIIMDSGHSVFIASTIVIIQSISVILSSILSPFLLSYLSPKRVLIGSQLISAIASGTLVLMIFSNFINIPTISGLIFILSLSSEFFKQARDLQSKLSDDTDHLRNQSKLLSGFYKAQFIGPLLSMAIVYKLESWIALFIDFLSYIATAMILIKSTDIKVANIKLNTFSAFKYIFKKRNLLIIFLLRSVGYWIGAGIFNYLMFSIITEHYKLDILNSAWVYSAVGLGAFLFSFIINNQNKIRGIKNKHLSFLGHIGLSTVYFGLIYLGSFPIALVILIIYGFFMGMNAIASQAIRRQLTTTNNFSEVVAAELFIGKITDVITSSMCFIAVTRYSINSLMLLSTIVTISVGFSYFFLKDEIPKAESQNK